MAIVTAGPIPGSTVVTGDSAYQLTLKEDWNIKTNDLPTSYATTDPLFFIGDPLFPAIGTVHPRNSALRFRTFGSFKHESANKWTVSGMEYSTTQRQLGSGNEDDFNEDRYDDVNPLTSDRSWSFSTAQKAVEKAYVSDPTGANRFVRPVDETLFPFSADKEPVAVKETGEPILGLTETIYTPVCNYVRNELVPPNGLVTGALVGAVNSDAITLDGYPVAAKTCLIEDVQMSVVKQSMRSNGTTITFRTLTYKLIVNNEGWDIDTLNHGYYAIYTNNAAPPVATVQRIKIVDGWDTTNNKKVPRPASTSQLIDVNGNWIDTDPSDPANANWRDKVHYRVFRVKQYVPFAPYNFS